MKQPRIVVVGSSNTDMVVRLARIPAPGETVGEGIFSRSQGGKGANQAVAAARAGGDVTLIACVGDDPFGNGAVNVLAQEGIHVDHIQLVRGTPTGVALITVDRHGENAISLAPGANQRLSPAHIDAAESCIAKADYLLVQLEIPFETAIYAIKTAARLGTKILLNPAPAREIPGNLLHMVNTLVVNVPEAAILCGLPVHKRPEARKAASFLYEKGAQQVVVSMGANGAMAMKNGEVFQVPSFPVNTVDTTGAGDVLCGTLGLRLALGDSFKEALRFASAAASLSVTRTGAQAAAPERLAIHNFLDLNTL